MTPRKHTGYGLHDISRQVARRAQREQVEAEQSEIPPPHPWAFEELAPVASFPGAILFDPPQDRPAA